MRLLEKFLLVLLGETSESDSQARYERGSMKARQAAIL